MLSQDYGVTMMCVIRTTQQCNAYCTLKIPVGFDNVKMCSGKCNNDDHIGR
jgi:hypothetical protein